METIEQRIARLQGEYNTFEGRENLTQDEVDRKNWLSNQLAEAQMDLKAQQEREGREQKQAEYIDGLLQAILNLGLFEAIVPQPEDGERMHEYTERKKEFNLLQYDFVKEQLLAQNALHNEDMAAKDEKIRIVTRQGLDAENQLAEARREIAEVKHDRDELLEHNQTLSEDIAERNAKIAEYSVRCEQQERAIETAREENARLVHENGRLRDQVAEANEKLEQSTKPAEYTAPSQPLQDRVASLKARSVDEMISRFNARQKEENQVQLPDLPQVLPFQSDPEPESSGDPVHVAEAIEAVENQFPEFPMAVHTPGESEAEVVTREEFEALKADVEVLKRRNGMVA